MYNVLIVDDEPMIREGMKTLIPWEEFGFQVIDTAKDGKEALEKYRANEIHLIIADIRMPRMSGIELIQTIRKEDNKVQFIILSGYADFEYAQKAIRENVAGYLLKPVEEEDLMGFIQKIKVNLDKEQSVNQVRTVSLQEVRHTVLQTLIDRNEKVSIEEIYGDISELGLDGRFYQLAMIQLFHNTNLELEDFRQQLAQDLEGNWGYLFIKDRNLCILLKNIRPSLKSYNELYDKVKSYLKNSSIVMCLSEVFDEISSLGSEYSSTKTILDNQFFYKETKFLRSDSDLVFQPKEEYLQGMPLNEFPVHSYAEKLYFALDALNGKAMKDEIINAAQMMISNNHTEVKIKINYIRLLSLVFSKCSVNKPELGETLSDVNAELHKINSKTTIQSLLEFIYSLLNKVITSLNVGNHEDQLKKLVDFIHRNYQENLKLESLARVFDYNSAYLGKIFKNHTGEYFNTYLDMVRMENAKKLLSGGMKVYQVAEKVGYSNVDYFHNKFKKYIGMSPSNFRKEKL
ncbi:response regulator transcription factor [Neobacillus sp. 3P2-tot-E-2]|uniref:response regulator transcription factor n=1 Tax=Neobacillus sp. 3P2-tot-E-2 TaxID=3132212 RepID=UPI0039A2BA31